LNNTSKKCIDTFETKGQDTSNWSKNLLKKKFETAIFFSETLEEKLPGSENLHREGFSLEINVLPNHSQGPDQALEQNAAPGSADGPLLCWQMQNAPQRR